MKKMETEQEERGGGYLNPSNTPQTEERTKPVTKMFPIFGTWSWPFFIQKYLICFYETDNHVFVI